MTPYNHPQHLFRSDFQILVLAKLQKDKLAQKKDHSRLHLMQLKSENLKGEGIISDPIVNKVHLNNKN